MTLTFHSSSQECEKAKTFCATYHNKFLIDLDGIWYANEICWFDGPNTHLILSSIQGTDP